MSFILFYLPRRLRGWYFQLLFISMLLEGLEDLIGHLFQPSFVGFVLFESYPVGWACPAPMPPPYLCFSAQLFDGKRMEVKHQSLLLQKPNFLLSLDCFREMSRSSWRAATTRTFWVQFCTRWVSLADWPTQGGGPLGVWRAAFGFCSSSLCLGAIEVSW